MPKPEGSKKVFKVTSGRKYIPSKSPRKTGHYLSSETKDMQSHLHGAERKQLTVYSHQKYSSKIKVS
jgi:hypothetical protein